MYFKFIRLMLFRILKGEWKLPAVSEITADDLLHQTNSTRPPLLIDVRTTQEFNSGFGHIPNARSLPLMQFEADFEDSLSFKEKVLELTVNFKDLKLFKEMQIVTICPGGGMSLVAAEILAEEHFRDVRSLKGGIDLWFKKGYPTTKSLNQEEN